MDNDLEDLCVMDPVIHPADVLRNREAILWRSPPFLFSILGSYLLGGIALDFSYLQMGP